MGISRAERIEALAKSLLELGVELRSSNGADDHLSPMENARALAESLLDSYKKETGAELSVGDLE